MKPPLSLIVAVSENGVIGKDGALPWRISSDLKRFRQLTLGKPCIMGRKTWESLPRKPLAGRTNIVVTRDSAFRAEGAEVAHDFDAAVASAAQENPKEIMIIGGQALYRESLPRAYRIYLTEVKGEFAGDVFLPPIDRRLWRETAREGPFEEDGVRFSYVTLERR